MRGCCGDDGACARESSPSAVPNALPGNAESRPEGRLASGCLLLVVEDGAHGCVRRTQHDLATVGSSRGNWRCGGACLVPPTKAPSCWSGRSQGVGGPDGLDPPANKPPSPAVRGPT